MRISDWSSDVCSSDLLSVEPHLAVSRASARQHRRNGHGPEAQGNRPRRGREPPGGVHRMTTDIIIYHNPECGTSRNTLAMNRNAGIEPNVVENLKKIGNRSGRERGCQKVSIMG